MIAITHTPTGGTSVGVLGTSCIGAPCRSHRRSATRSAGCRSLASVPLEVAAGKADVMQQLAAIVKPCLDGVPPGGLVATAFSANLDGRGVIRF